MILLSAKGAATSCGLRNSGSLQKIQILRDEAIPGSGEENSARRHNAAQIFSTRSR
jgi:hypothetical protein